MTDEYDSSEAREPDGEMNRREGQSPVVRPGVGNYVPVFAGEPVPLPKVEELSPKERKILDAKHNLHPDATTGQPVCWERSLSDILKSLGVIALVGILMWCFFPWDIFKPKPDSQTKTPVTANVPNEKDIKQYKQDPDAMLPYKRAWVELYLQMQQGRANDACNAGDEYWGGNTKDRSSKEWEPAWETYLSALSATRELDKLSEVANVLYGNFPDNIAISMQYAKSQLIRFNKEYPSIENREHKKKNSPKTDELNTLLNGVIRACTVAESNLTGSRKKQDPNHALPAAIKAQARFYQWKLQGKERWYHTGTLEESIKYAKSGNTPIAKSLREEMADYCYNKWGLPWMWNRYVCGEQCSRDKLKEYILKEERQ